MVIRTFVIHRQQSNIRVKSYGNLNLLGTSMSNFERLDILWSAIRHPNKKLWQFEFVRKFHVQFRAARYIIVRNQTSESKVIVV